MRLPTLRPDQDRTIAGISNEFRCGHRRVICQAPTRSGKTVISCKMMATARDRGKRSLFLAQSRQIVTQTLDALDEYEVPRGAMMDGYAVEPHHEIQVGSVQSLLSWCDREEGGLSWPQADVVFLDECHSEAYWRIHHQYPKAYIVGLSATPVGPDGRGLGVRLRKVFRKDDDGKQVYLGEYKAGYDALVIGATYSEMLSVGQIVPIRIYSQHRDDFKPVAANEDAIEIQERAAQYMEDARLVGEVVKTWKEHGQNRQTLYFAQSVAHSIMLRDAFIAAGISAEHIDGSSPDSMRDHIRRRSAGGETRIVCNCNTLHTGVNWNWISCVGVARLVASLPLWRQMTARGAGRHHGKQDCILLDHGGVALVFGSPDIDIHWPLDAKRSAEKEYLRKRRDATRRDGEPGACAVCGVWIDFGKVCGKCGSNRQGREYHHEDGKLVELDLFATGSPPPSGKSSEQRKWDSFLWAAAASGQTINQAAGRFYKETGLWPGKVPGLANVPTRENDWKLPVRELFPHMGKRRARAAT
jgi:DNA repair protein RadD